MPARFKGEPADEREAKLHDLADLFNGTIRLQGDMDLTGNSAELTFYRAPKERNIMTQFFYLPRGDVSVGDHWPLPVQPIELGAGFFVQEGTIHNRVTLTGVTLSGQ